MNRSEIAEDILNREWNLFQQVQNVGGRASCQEDERTFRIMRAAQFEAWNEAMLASYQKDLIRAEEAGRNPLSEKYGYMMRSTHPEEYEQIRELLPPVSQEKGRLVEEILAIEMPQTAKFRAMYPNLGRRGRPLTAEEDHGAVTSVETYTRGELTTYSEQTLELYLNHLQKLEQNKVLFPMIVMKATVRANGYFSLDEAEKACR
ncbi:DUF4125 family protein [bacterium 210917-SL.2.15]|nr:DUF4125 family protein [bacterium 210917-SL.2.15]